HRTALRRGDAVRLAALRRRVRVVHGTEPLRAAVIRRLRRARPLLLGAVSVLHLVGKLPIASPGDGAGRGVRDGLHARAGHVRHDATTFLSPGSNEERADSQAASDGWAGWDRWDGSNGRLADR